MDQSPDSGAHDKLESSQYEVLLNPLIATDPRQFVAKWLIVSGVEINSASGFKEDGKRTRQSSIESRLLLDYHKIISTINDSSKAKIFPLKDDLLKKALGELVAKHRLEQIEKVKKSVKFEENSNFDELRKFIKAITGDILDVDVAVIKHLIWQVKRKLNELEVTNHLMPILVGPQRSGKSTAVKKLTDVIVGLVANLAIPQITDDRYAWALEEHYVILCDEMSGMVRADLEKVKYVLTAQTITSRPLHTTTYDKIPNNSTFIGTSNKQLHEVIKDETGLGRFYPMQTLPVIDWEVINSIDYMNIWQSVDENRTEGYLTDVLHEIRAIQDQHTLKGCVDQFVEHFSLLGPSMKTEVPGFELYGIFKNFCSENGLREIESGVFGKKLKALGVLSRREAIKNKKYTVYFVSDDVELPNVLNQTLMPTKK